MPDLIKLLGSEIALSTANTVSSASVVRVNNNSGAAVVITRANTGGTIGTCTMATGEIGYFVKQPADTIASNVAVRAVSVAFSQ
jgi:hypothetical protein